MKPNILVIEDEEGLWKSIAEIFEYEDIAFMVAQNGCIGVQLARESVPDLILCDIMMPDMDGYSVLRELRGDALTTYIPFVFLTAKADRSSLRYGMNLGADDYLTKPFTSDELLTAIKTGLEKKASLEREYSDEANHLRQTLVHSLPHELRTPLSGILGGAEILLIDAASSGNEELTSTAQMILESGKRLQRLIENYLFYAQLQIIRFDKDRLKVLQQGSTEAPGALISDLAGAKAAMVDRRGDLRINVSDEIVFISAENLKKIVDEILDNAFKFSKLGFPVNVWTEHKDHTYILNISDSGCGMSVDQVKNVAVFMQFERKLHEQQGSGLGLAIAHQLVDLHRGEFLIQSAPEHGTTVSMTLPAADTN